MDSSSVQRCIVDDVWASNLDADYDDRWLFADPGGRHGGSDEQRYNRFVRKLLGRSPKHRFTAADALGDVLFRNVEDAGQRSDSLVQVRFISLPKFLQPLPLQRSHNDLHTDPFLLAVVGAQLRVDIEAEVLSDSSPSDEPFHSREGYRAYAEDDEEIPGATIYVLRFGERFRLHLTASYAEGCQLPIRVIESVVMKTSEDEIVPLKLHTVYTDGVRLEAAVLVDPSAFGGHFGVCPMYGTVNERYRKTTLQLTFGMGDDSDAVLVKNCDLHFLIVGSRRKLRRYRLARTVRQQWSLLPKPAKRAIRLFCHGVVKAVECAMPF